MEKDTLVKLIVIVTALLIAIAVVVKLKSLSVQSTNQELCRMSILKSWKTHSFSILNPFGRFRHPGFYGCKTTYAVITSKGIFEDNEKVVDFSSFDRNKEKINDAIMKFLADEMATCWSTFYEGNSNLFDFNDIMKRVYGDTGAICITCDDINIEYLPYGEINYTTFIDFLKNNYLNVTSEDNSIQEESYYDYLYKKQAPTLKNLNVRLGDIIKTELHATWDARNILRSNGVTTDPKKVIATLVSSIYPSNESATVYTAQKPKDYLKKLGKIYNVYGNTFFSCDDKEDLFKSSNSGTILEASSGAAYCDKDSKAVFECINKTVYKVNGYFCSGNVIMNCTSAGPVKVKTCTTSCEYGECTKAVRVSKSNKNIKEGEYYILFYVVGRPIYMNNPVPFILMINSKNLFNSCDWLSLR